MSKRSSFVGREVTSADFDVGALFAALDSEREARSLSWTGLTREVNALFRDVPCPPIAASTVTGMRDRREVIGNAALQMLVWLDRTPESFIPGREDTVAPMYVLPRLEPDRILRFDTRAIFLALDEVRVDRGLSWRQVAEQMGGVTAASLTRLGKGAGVGIAAAARIAQWLQRPLASLTVASSR